MDGKTLSLRLNAASLRDALNQIESSGRKLEELDVLMVVCDYDGERLEGYVPSSVSTLELKDKSYVRIKAFSENAEVYNIKKEV